MMMNAVEQQAGGWQQAGWSGSDERHPERMFLADELPTGQTNIFISFIWPVNNLHVIQ